MNKPTLLILDLETTGLDPRKHVIIEVGAIAVTDQYEPVAKFERVIYANKFDLAAMDDYVLNMHTVNGLLKECVESNNKMHDVDVALAAFINDHMEAGKVQLTGNSIHFDRQFLEDQFPNTAKLLHYRMNDLGAVERFLRLSGVDVEAAEDVNHRSMADCENELLQAQRMYACLNRLSKK